MTTALSIRGLQKTYANGFEALKGIDLDVQPRVYLEYGTKGKIGTVMILILVAAIMGVILAALKLLLMLDEESLTY